MTRRVALLTLLVAVAALATGYEILAAHRAVPNNAIDLKALGDFPLGEGDPSTTNEAIPKRFRDLDGKPITLTGFVYAPNAASDQINSFQFVYDLSNREHRGPPQAHECVFATVAGGRTIENPGTYTIVATHGVLHVGIQRDQAGKICSVYTMDVDRVTPIP